MKHKVSELEGAHSTEAQTSGVRAAQEASEGEGDALTARVCTKCGKSKPLDAFSKGVGYAHGRKAQCRDCVREYMRAYNASEYGHEAQQRMKLKGRAKPTRSPEKVSQYGRANAARLPDGYVRGRLVHKHGIPLSAITRELIDLKREQLRLRRLARELKKAAAKEPNETVR